MSDCMMICIMPAPPTTVIHSRMETLSILFFAVFLPLIKYLELAGTQHIFYEEGDPLRVCCSTPDDK